MTAHTNTPDLHQGAAADSASLAAPPLTVETLQTALVAFRGVLQRIEAKRAISSARFDAAQVRYCREVMREVTQHCNRWHSDTARVIRDRWPTVATACASALPTRFAWLATPRRAEEKLRRLWGQVGGAVMLRCLHGSPGRQPYMDAQQEAIDVTSAHWGWHLLNRAAHVHLAELTSKQEGVETQYPLQSLSSAPQNARGVAALESALAALWRHGDGSLTLRQTLAQIAVPPPESIEDYLLGSTVGRRSDRESFEADTGRPESVFSVSSNRAAPLQAGTKFNAWLWLRGALSVRNPKVTKVRHHKRRSRRKRNAKAGSGAGGEGYLYARQDDGGGSDGGGGGAE